MIWLKADLTKHITAIKKKTHLLKMSKHIGICVVDLYLCAIYTPPSESPYYEEELCSSLHTEIFHIQAQGETLLCGDFNAPTGSEPD